MRNASENCNYPLCTINKNMSDNIANVPNADDQFLKSLTMDSEQIKDRAKDLNNKIQSTTEEEFKTDDVFRYIIDESKDILISSREVLESMGKVLQMLPDPEFAKAYASVLQSSASIVRNITDVAASKEKSITAVQIKEMDIQAKKDLKEMDHSIAEIEGPKTVNVIMTREEIMNRLIKTAKAEEPTIKVIDI